MSFLQVALDWDYTPPANALGIGATEFAATPLTNYAAQTPINSGPRTDSRPISEPTYTPTPGARANSWADDSLERIYLTPAEVGFGNIIGNAQQPVEVWNAFSRDIRVDAIAGTGTDGVSIAGPSALPINVGPYAIATFTVSVSPSGPPTLSATYEFDFSNGDSRTLSLEGKRIIAWQWAPTWQRGVLERLEWKTDVLSTANGREQRRKLRKGARRFLEFDVIVSAKDRRRLETAVGGWQARTWALPLWWSARFPTSPIGAGATSIAMSTASSDFRAGGLALILADDGSNEVVEVASVGSTSITLVRPTLGAWPTQARVFPAIPARADPAVAISRFDNATGYFRVRFIGTEPADFTAAPPATTFLGYPVIEARPMLPGEMSVGVARRLDEFDPGIGAPVVFDQAGLAFFQQAHGWLGTSVAEKAALRGLFYALAGRFGAVWLPSWMEDLTVVENIGLGATSIDVESTGYARYTPAMVGRNHVAIYLRNGSVQYHKITGAVEVSATVERLSITPAPAAAIAVGDVLRVSFLQLVRQASDAIELQHWTHETLEASAGFVSFRHDL